MFTQKYFGYVVGTVQIPLDPEKPDGPTKTAWKVRVKKPDGTRGPKFTIEDRHVPQNIAAGRDVRFDVVTNGPESKPIAVDVEIVKFEI